MLKKPKPGLVQENGIELVAEQDKVLSSLRSWIALVLFILSLLYIVAVVVLAINTEMTRKNNGSHLNADSTLPAVDYLEDKTGQFTLQYILDTEASGNQNADAMQWRPSTDFQIGNSRSTWWVRIRTDDIKKIDKTDEGEYFSILTPSVEKVALYMPVQAAMESGGGDDAVDVTYRLYEAGWGIPRERHTDVSFSYPTFRIDSNLAAGRYVYLRLNSIYTQNYTFKIFTNDTLALAQKFQTAMVSFFVGFLLALGISNLIQYSALGIFANLFYIIYLMTIILYQISVQGLSRLFFGRSAEFLIGGIAPFGMAMFVSGLLFFQYILGFKKNFPWAHKATWLVISIFLLTFAAFFAGFGYEANLLTIIFADLTSLLILIVSFLAIRRKFSYAKYMFAGWVVTLLSSFVFHLRFIGVFPNNEFTSFIILIPHIIEVILLSLGIAELNDQIRREKQQAVEMHRLAEGQVLAKESAFLQSQIRPHFLYNSLNVIEALCYIDGKKAGGLIQDFSKFLRHSFDSRNLELSIDFKEELEYIQAYLKIEQARFPNKINVEYDLDDTEGLKIPPLLLQPLIENAVKHGIREKDGKGTVRLRVRVQGDSYEITVEDDGIGMTEQRIKEVLSEDSGKRGGVGLANIQKRLKMFYNTKLTIESAPGKGTKIHVTLPKKGEL